MSNLRANLTTALSASSTADHYLSLQLVWDSAKASGLAAAQPQYVAAMDGEAPWLIAAAPSRSTLGSVPPDKLAATLDALSDKTSSPARTVFCTW